MQVGTNGIVSFGSPFMNFEAYLFPHTNGSNIYDSYIVAPYWTDNDARRNGRVTWEIYSTSDGLVKSTEIIRRVRHFIRLNTNNRGFNGNFVFVANWSEMHPYPAGYAQRMVGEYDFIMYTTYVCMYILFRTIRIKLS